jgi:hypothetical protein
MTQVNYIVIKKFKYGDKLYRSGDIFEPAGGKWDDQIIDPDNGYTRLEVVKPTRRGRKVADGKTA